MNVEQEVKAAMNAAVDHLRQELKGLRTGRANPALLDSIHVEVYGTSMRLKELANVTVPELRQLLITPYDANNVQNISKAIEEADLNVQPQVNGKVIRINFPPMDESIRKDIVKQCKKRGEETKIAIREVRRKYNDIIRKKKAQGEMPEDEMKRQEKMIQEMTDSFCKEIDTSCTAKEKEILEI